MCCFSSSISSPGNVRALNESSFPNQLFIYKPEARAAYLSPIPTPPRSFPLGTGYGSGWSLGSAFFKAQCSLLTKALLMANARKATKQFKIKKIRRGGVVISRPCKSQELKVQNSLYVHFGLPLLPQPFRSL